MATIFTIGHSTRELAELIQVLTTHEIDLLVDIRAFPMSQRLPHFNREALMESLAKSNIRYTWEKDLGGRRKKQPPPKEVLQKLTAGAPSPAGSPNSALRSSSFRNYADYMLTPTFEAAIRRVIESATRERVAIMCAERVYFRCHRMLVSDYLMIHGHEVLHIDGLKPPKPHNLMSEARLMHGCLIYPDKQMALT